MTVDRPIHLLFLEDNPDDVYLLTAALKRFRLVTFDVVQVPRLAEAIQVLQQSSFDMVITDLNLPDSLGVPTVKELIENARGVPVIALTGWDDPVLGAQLVEQGAACYWSKDRINGGDLPNAIVDIFNRNRVQS